jgi:hypothetical protein
MNTTSNQPSASEITRDHMIKWIGAALFAGIVVIGGYAIYQASHETHTPTALSSSPTPTANAQDVAAQGTPAPASVTTSADLSAADQALSSSDIDSTTADLLLNDTDLASF